ncbi:hypothetical protein GCM10028824_07490 [Hymenobacter segetis]
MPSILRAKQNAQHDVRRQSVNLFAFDYPENNILAPGATVAGAALAAGWAESGPGATPQGPAHQG